MNQDYLIHLSWWVLISSTDKIFRRKIRDLDSN